MPISMELSAVFHLHVVVAVIIVYPWERLKISLCSDFC